MHRGMMLVLVALGAVLMPHFAAAQDEELELSVRNRTAETMTVFALWDTRTRARLGDLRPNQTREFTIPKRGDEVTLTVQVQGQRGRSGGNRPEDFARVGPGDQLEWEILSTDPLDLLFRHVGSVFAFNDASGGGDPGEPRMSRYTVISQAQIQEAQALEDDSLQAATYRSALAAVNDGLSRETDNPMAFLHLGIIHAGLKNYVAADIAFDQAEALYPAYVDEEGGTGAYRLNAWLDAYNDATLRLEVQDSEGALDLFRMANMLYDRRVEAYLNIGVTAGNLGDMEVSIDAWRSALTVIESPDGNPGDDATRQTWDTDFWIMAQSNIGRLLSNDGRADEAVVVFEAILERFSDNGNARSSLALALVQSGQEDGALGIFDDILERDDATPLDYFNAGVSLYAADQMDRAVLAFEKTVGRSSMYRDAVQNLAQTLNQLENYEAQIPHSEKLIELDPFNDYAYLMHARALVQIGRDQDGVAVMEIMQALPFVIDQLTLQPMPAGARVTGIAVNKALDPGTSITLRFTFYDDDGNSVGSADTEVTISDPDVAHAFDVTFDGETQVLGYSYELVG